MMAGVDSKWVVIAVMRFGIIVELGLHGSGYYAGWGKLKWGFRVDLGWFTDRSYEIGVKFGLQPFRPRIEVHLKLLKLSVRVWAGR